MTTRYTIPPKPRRQCVCGLIPRYCKTCDPVRYRDAINKSRINIALKASPLRYSSPRETLLDSIGISTVEELWKWLMKQPSYEQWMTLQNRGKYYKTDEITGRRVWNIDHIIPLRARGSGENGEITDDDLVMRRHYTNLQALPARINLRKGSRTHPLCLTQASSELSPSVIPSLYPPL